jgi:AcrR family transcriptional regulator
MVKNIARPRGRPRSFDEAEALARATKVFLAKGYDGATIDDLVEGMGVRRPSLYAIFGDKADLFMKCLEEYGNQLGTLAAHALLSPPDVQGAIRGLLRFSVENATGEGSPVGCLIVCVAPLVDDDRVRLYLLRMTDQATKAVEQRLKRGIDAGELPPDFPVELRARQTLDLSRGLTIRARIGASREELLADADEAASLILPNRLA